MATDLVNGHNTLRPGRPNLELSPTPALFEKFSRFEPAEQLEIIDVLKRMSAGRSFNDALHEVFGGPDTVAPKSWRNL